MRELCITATAFFIFLTAAAWAGVITSYGFIAQRMGLRSRLNGTLNDLLVLRRRFPRAVAALAKGQWSALLGDFCQHIAQIIHVRSGTENTLADLLTDLRHEIFKEMIGLVFIFVQRILLAITAQHDASAQLFHLGEMILPMVVN